MRGILALFIRSLRESVRVASFAWMRAGMTTVVLLTLLFFKGMDQLGAAGMEFFLPFAVYNAAMIAIAALSYFASAITEEKEEQTLGLLRMTDLSVLAILFGKSTSRMLSGIMLLAVQFPFALLAVTLGGMTWEQIAITYAILCGFLVFAANLGLLASVLAPTGAKAGIITGFTGFIYLFPQLLIALIAWACRFLSEDSAVAVEEFGNLWENYCGPNAFFQTIGIGSTSQYWEETILCFVIASATYFLLAWALFSRFAHDEIHVGRRKENAGSLGWLKPRAGRVWTDAIAWKDFHFILGGRRTFVTKTILYLLLTGWIGWDSLRNSYGSVQTFSAFLFSWAIFFLFWEVVLSASRLFRMEQRWQTLGSLYTLPQDVPALRRSKRTALLRSLIPCAFINGIALVAGFPFMLEGIFRGPEPFLVFLQFAILFPIEAIFHYRLVAWLSMRLRWGGLPSALVISFFGHIFVGGFLILGARSVAGLPFIMIMAGVNAGLRLAITRNIEANAALG